MMPSYLGRCFQRAVSLRVIGYSFLAGFVTLVLAEDILGIDSDVGATFGVIAWLGAWVAISLNDRLVLNCDECGSRVKLGFRTCRHCGYTRVQGDEPPGIRRL